MDTMEGGTAYMEEPRAATAQADSEEEAEAKDQKDSAFELTCELDSLGGALTDGGKVVVCN